jgi:carbamoyltransferase
VKTCVVNLTAHDGSICYLEDGEIIYFIQEERLSRRKYDDFPVKSLIELTKYTNTIDCIILTGTLPNGSNEIIKILSKYFKITNNIVSLTDKHHFAHACSAFYDSGFNEAACIVVDGAGSFAQENHSWEVESIFHFHNLKDVELISQKRMSIIDGVSQVSEDGKITTDGKPGVVKMYEAVTEYLGHHYIEAGKTMGLAAYGQLDSDIKILINKIPNMNLFIQNYPSGAIINVHYLGKEKTLETQKNLAYAVQQASEEILRDVIDKAYKKTNCKNITISGGYGMNCVANYNYLKYFPDLNIFISIRKRLFISPRKNWFNKS